MTINQGEKEQEQEKHEWQLWTWTPWVVPIATTMKLGNNTSHHAYTLGFGEPLSSPLL